jgi:hypothetical protein
MQGHIVKIVDGIALLLPTIGIQVLRKVTFLVQQTPATRGRTQVAGSLEVVASQDT